MFNLDGLDWKSWTAADRVSVMFYLLKKHIDPENLRHLYELVGDKDAVAALDREKMGQPPQIETTL